MTSHGKNESLSGDVAHSRRPARSCRKRTIVDSDSDNSLSEVVPKNTTRRKRTKLEDDSDTSFRIEDEEKKVPKAKPKKRVKKENGEEENKAGKTSKKVKKSPVKGSRKRVKQEKVEETCDNKVSVKNEENELCTIPLKKVKTEFPLLDVKKEKFDTEIFQEKSSSFQSAVKKENNEDYNSSSSKHMSTYGPTVNQSSASNCDWRCITCNGYNYSWRRQCFRCKADRPMWEDSETIIKQDIKPPIGGSRENVRHVKQEKISSCKPAVKVEIDSKFNALDSKHSNQSSAPHSDWQCVTCSGYNNAWRQQCFRCNADRLYKKDHETVIKKDIKPQASVSNSDQNVQSTKVNCKAHSEQSGTTNFDLNEDQVAKECRLVTKRSNVPYHIVSNVIKLFNSDATVPFIVRYRSHLTGGLPAEEIRQLKHHHESVQKVIEKAKNMKKKLESLGYLNIALSQAIDSCVTQSELDYLNEPFKVLKSSKLVKVIDLGLSTPAERILQGNGRVSLEQYIKDDLDLNEIIDLVVYFVGETMSKDSELLDKVRELMKFERIILASKQKTTATKKKVAESVPKKNRPEDVYSNYYDYECPYNRVRPHQILAINRGEAENCLQVSLTIPGSFQNKLCHFARNKWYFKGFKYELRDNIFKKGLDFMYNKRVSPYLKRLIRSELTKQGEKASLEVFSSNLKYLLLTPPIRNVTVCSIDPGFTHGCKIAILNPQQVVLQTDVLYLNNPHHFGFRDCAFVRYLNDYNVDLLVVGNGKGCRDVEFQISQLINSNSLNKAFKYIVASENGISVYSCSAEAKEEYPNLSPNIISAISLAKRVQDPLCELVKVEPKHLGVGMYQHDLNAKKLDSVLDDVVSECVSIVGVDVNNAPLRILKRVAGLTESKAKTVIETREKQGSFFNRDDLKKVKGIGPKTFQQCAGFIKVIPGTCLMKNENDKPAFNYLDQTIIHPEDYAHAKTILKMNGLQPDKIGSSDCVSKLRSFMTHENIPALAQKLNIPPETLKLILEALTSPLDYDIRSTFDKPLFRNKATSINDLVLNSVISGQVENVTHFGAFVDLGIECSGLIPHKNMQGRDLHLGQIVNVKITEIDTRKMRISLLLVNVKSSSD